MAGRSHFFEMNDDTGVCGDQPVTRAFIERVEFAGFAVSVTASFGRRASVDPQDCSPSRVKSYHLDFVFDGRDYKPTPASAETARLFASQ